DPGLDPVGCNIDCTTSSCGDGKINKAAGEECDNGVNNSIHGDCTAPIPAHSYPGCKINVCGDGFQDTVGQHKEACDRNPPPTSNCSASCIPIGCGHGVVNGDGECSRGG